MELITPPILKPGDTIGIVAPARKISQAEVEPAIKLIKSWGFNVALGANIYGEYNQFSGTDVQRASDLQGMFERPDIAAILCARGGYGSVRLLDLANLRELQRNPKWIIGYSDITVFHSILTCWYMVETIHGTMPLNFPKDGTPNESTESLRRLLIGESPTYTFSPHHFNCLGEASGTLTGGNLSILYSLSGTDADITTEDKILFIEDLDEYLYHVDRMMMNLKRSGKLKNLAGLIVGSMNGMNDNTVPFGKTAYEIVQEAVQEYDFPVCFGFPAGHQEPNLAMIMGRKVSLFVDNNEVKLEFSPAVCKL